jgi:transcriptional regulator with XRE-family HTH domain
MKSHPHARRRALSIAILDSGQTQADLARRLGMERTRLCRIVRGVRAPQPEEREAIALALARHPADLFPDEGGARGSST